MYRLGTRHLKPEAEKFSHPPETTPRTSAPVRWDHPVRKPPAPVGNTTTANPATCPTDYFRRQYPGTVGATHPTTTARRQANTPSAIPSSCLRNARCVARAIRTGDNDPFASPGPFPTPRGKELAPVPSPDGEEIKGWGDRANVLHCRGPRMLRFAPRNGGRQADRMGEASPVFPSLRCISRTPPLQPPLLAQRMPGPYGSLLSVSPGPYGSNTRRKCDDRHSRHRRGNASDDHRAAPGHHTIRQYPGTVGATHPTITARRQANTPSAIPSSCPRNARCVARTS